MKKYFLDSNIFLRLFTTDDEKIMNECSSLVKIIKLGQIRVFVSNFILAEIIWTLGSTYKYPKNKIIEVIDTIVKLPNLKIDDSNQILIALKYFKLYNVKYIDALIASNPDIQAKKMVIVSYDKDFDKLKVKRLEPKDLL